MTNNVKRLFWFITDTHDVLDQHKISPGAAVCELLRDLPREAAAKTTLATVNVVDARNVVYSYDQHLRHLEFSIRGCEQ